MGKPTSHRLRRPKPQIKGGRDGESVGGAGKPSIFPYGCARKIRKMETTEGDTSGRPCAHIGIGVIQKKPGCLRSELQWISDAVRKAVGKNSRNTLREKGEVDGTIRRKV